MARRPPQDSSKRLQDAPTGPQDAQEEPRRAPREPQEGSSGPQDNPIRLQGGPQEAPRKRTKTPRGAKESPKRVPGLTALGNLSRSYPGPFGDTPEAPEEPRRCPKAPPARFPNAPKTLPEGSQWSPSDQEHGVFLSKGVGGCGASLKNKRTKTIKYIS